MKRGIILAIMLLTAIPLCSASLEDHISQAGTHVMEYNIGKIDAAKLVVYLEYIRNKMYEEQDKAGEPGFTETDIKGIFDEKPKVNTNDPMQQEMMLERGMFIENPLPNNGYSFPDKEEYLKTFETDDFNVVFKAFHFYRTDREYYQKRELEAENYYRIDYFIEPKEKLSTIGEDIKSELDSFLNEFKTLHAAENVEVEQWEALNDKFMRIKARVNTVKGRKECEELLGSFLEKKEEQMLMESMYTMKVMEETEQNCMPDNKCDQVCKPEQVCYEKCEPKQVCQDICKEVCANETVCESACGNNTATNQTCTEKCEMKNICKQDCQEGTNCVMETKCEQVCNEEQKCNMECKEEQRCENRTAGEFRIDGRCSKDFSDININTWGTKLGKYNELNKYMQTTPCQKGDIDAYVALRKAFQKSFNNDFVSWYFDEFLANDPEKITNGGDAIKKIIGILTTNEEQISSTLFCEQTMKWPEGFESIDITYNKSGVFLEVWEKLLPVEWRNTKLWTTLYQYTWMPDKELLKKLIIYKIEAQNMIGPSSRNIAEIRADDGKMELVRRLAETYGGSFDVKIELNEKGMPAIRKYFQVNPEVVATLSDSIPEKEDIAIIIDYDALYNFIRYMKFTTEGNRISGPSWVSIEDMGPGKVLGILGAASKMWREGVKITPRRAFLKLLLNAKNLFSLTSDTDYEQETATTPPQIEPIKITGEAVLERGH